MVRTIKQLINIVRKVFTPILNAIKEEPFAFSMLMVFVMWLSYIIFK